MSDVPVQLISCIAEGRDPTLNELFAQAERIWIEAGAERSAFAWTRLPAGSADRVSALRAAQVALSGADRIG